MGTSSPSTASATAAVPSPCWATMLPVVGCVIECGVPRRVWVGAPVRAFAMVLRPTPTVTAQHTRWPSLSLCLRNLRGRWARTRGIRPHTVHAGTYCPSWWRSPCASCSPRCAPSGYRGGRGSRARSPSSRAGRLRRLRPAPYATTARRTLRTIPPTAETPPALRLGRPACQRRGAGTARTTHGME
jgi:hypothetical protein